MNLQCDMEQDNMPNKFTSVKGKGHKVLVIFASILLNVIKLFYSCAKTTREIFTKIGRCMHEYTEKLSAPTDCVSGQHLLSYYILCVDVYD